MYDKIFTFTEHLFKILQIKTVADITLCRNEIQTTLTSIKELRTEEVLSNCLEEIIQLNPQLEDDLELALSSKQTKVAYEILDSIVTQLEIRFGNVGVLSFTELLNEKQFLAFKKSFPKAQFQMLLNTYPNVFNADSLQNELINIYSSTNKILSPKDLLSFIVDNELECVYVETYKLLKVILSIPATSASSERSMSTLKRVKTFLRSLMTDERLSELATLTIEKELTYACSRDPQFKDKVIDMFAAMKNRRMELTYKITH